MLEAGLGQTAVRVTAHYTLPDLSVLTGNDDSRLPLLLDYLEQELGLPFNTTHAMRLGNFERFNLHPWLDRPQPFLVEAVSPDIDGGASTYQICRTCRFAEAEHRAHIVGRVNGDVILDRLFILSQGDLRCTFEAAERLDEIELRLFDVNGDLLHSEKNAFMNRIGFVLAPVHRQVSIEDDLSVRAGQARRAASVVRSHSSMRSLIGGPKPGSWRKFAEDVAHTVALRAPAPSEDRWFPRGIEGELGAIAHLNGLLDGASARRAVLVDPWFGTEALHQLAMRLASVDIEITILTSWLDKDPDTGERLDDASLTDMLAGALEKVKIYLNPRLSLINLVDGSERAFHDRYLLLYPYEGLSKVFLLSNSLNAAGRNWPFAMSLMAADAAREARLYIEGLNAGTDIARNRQLQANFRWTNHVQPAAR